VVELFISGRRNGSELGHRARKRQRYRESLDGFDPQKIARYARKKGQTVARRSASE